MVKSEFDEPKARQKCREIAELNKLIWRHPNSGKIAEKKINLDTSKPW